MFTVLSLPPLPIDSSLDLSFHSHLTRVNLMYAHRFEFHLKSEASEVWSGILIVVFIRHTRCSLYDKRALGSVNRRANKSAGVSALWYLIPPYQERKGFILHFLTHFFPSSMREVSAVEIIILCKKSSRDDKGRLEWCYEAYDKALNELCRSEDGLGLTSD